MSVDLNPFDLLKCVQQASWIHFFFYIGDAISKLDVWII